MGYIWVYAEMPSPSSSEPQTQQLGRLAFLRWLGWGFRMFLVYDAECTQGQRHLGLLASSRLASSVHHFLFAICQPACLGSAQLPLWWNARRASTRLLQHFWRLCCFLTRSVLQTAVAAPALYNRVHELSPLATAVPTVDSSSSHPPIPCLLEPPSPQPSLQ